MCVWFGRGGGGGVRVALRRRWWRRATAAAAPRRLLGLLRPRVPAPRRNHSHSSGKKPAAAAAWRRCSVLCVCAAAGGAPAPETGAVLRQFGGAAPGPSAAAGQGVCAARACGSLDAWRARCTHCVVLLGALQLALLETAAPGDFDNVSFPNLREVTEFVVVYRVAGLRSLGQLFPNLARIRGRRLLHDFALVIHDVDSLAEIGLYGLTRIDRGGVAVWGVGAAACAAHAVAWARIAPRGRVVLPARPERCAACRCDLAPENNYCWNNRKCQIYVEGAAAEACGAQCLGCRKTRADACSLCRHYTHRGRCLAACPADTLILPECEYCVSRGECLALQGWAWNGTCVFRCPQDYAARAAPGGASCVYQPDFDKSCESLYVWSLGAAQAAAGCARVRGALEVRVRRAPGAARELRAALAHLREVDDYVHIYGSSEITSLDFLPSLRRIGGRKLKDNKYSVLIHDMPNLRTLFESNVTRNLRIERGTARLFNNPLVCEHALRALAARLPAAARGAAELPPGMNGYGGACGDAPRFQLRALGPSAALVMFPAPPHPAAQCSVLYARLPRAAPAPRPEACSAAEWRSAAADAGFGRRVAVVELTSLRPASRYAICIETYDPVRGVLARSDVSDFTTPVGRPEPSFLLELAAPNATALLVRWLDHEDYLASITHYELDVALLDIPEKDIIGLDQCKLFEYADADESRHAVVSRPPAQYARACEATCGAGGGARGEEYFDVCGAIGCEGEERAAPRDSDAGRYVRTRRLRLAGPADNCTVGGLAPFRDYRVRLRACAGAACSRSARGVVRTRASLAAGADVPAAAQAALAPGGRLAVRWHPPEETNGPILSYSVEIRYDPAGDAPQSRCVPGNKTGITLDPPGAAPARWVRVCARSLASDATCGGWVAVEAEGGGAARAGWWGGAGGACLAALAALACRYRRSRRAPPGPAADRDPILAASASLPEDDPPSLMLSNLCPMYDIPLRDTRLP